MKSFHAFRLDTVNHCVWRGKARLSLAPKAFDVLRYLFEHADRLVAQEEILEALWPETYVNPEVVKKYVLGIRKALGDDPANPAFIATFPRRGYQFVAPVREETPAQHSTTAPKANQALVGRQIALDQLQRSLENALRGQRQIVFITGEAGIGKTTLLDAFLGDASLEAGVKIARGQCVEGFGGKEVYYPLLESFGQLLRESCAGPLFETFSKRAPTWMVQFPYLLDVKQREALEREIAGATRERMVREICEALEAVAAQNLLVLCLEDLHWVDPSTLDVISALARRRGPAKLLILATYRPADVMISQSPLKGLKQDLVVHDLSREIALERLERPDVAEYLSVEFPDANFPDQFAEVIFQHSGGNALFMVAILQDMVKKGMIGRRNGQWELALPPENISVNVPETLDQLIGVQFQQLSPAEQRILRIASVAGERFSIWALAAAAELDSAAIEETCDALVERLQFLKSAGIDESPNGEPSAHYEFRHSFYREVLYRRQSEASRSKLHLLLAQRLQAICNPCRPEVASELALHFEGGRDHGQAVHYFVLAAENAAARFAYRDSIGILQHALQLAAKLNPALRPGLEVRVLEAIGDAHFALGALPESGDAYGSAASRAAEAGLKSAQVHALLCAMYPLGFIDPDKGLAALDQAVETSVSVGDPLLLARAQMLASTCHLIFDEWTHKSTEVYLSARKRMLSLGDPCTDPHQQVAHAHAIAMMGEHQQALDIFDAAMDCRARGAGLVPRFGALSGKTMVLVRMGRLGDALRIIRSARESADGNKARLWLLGLREAWIRVMAFDRAGAWRICDEISKASSECLPGQPEALGLIARGYMALDRGEYMKAIDVFTPVAAPWVAAKFFLHWAWRMTAQMEIANAWLLSGNPSKANAAANVFFESALSTGDPLLHALAWEVKARVAMAENDLPAAREHIHRALAIVHDFEVIVAWQIYATAWQISLRTDNHDAAAEHRNKAHDCILKIADSFDADEPLRESFLSAAPVALVPNPSSSEEVFSVASERR